MGDEEGRWYIFVTTLTTIFIGYGGMGGILCARDDICTGRFSLRLD